MKKFFNFYLLFPIYIIGFIASTYDFFFYEGRSSWHSAFYALLFLGAAWAQFNDYRKQKEIEKKKQYYSEN